MRNSFLKELKLCVAVLADTIKIHQSSIAHVCVTKYGSYISGGGGGCILIKKKNPD